SSVPVPAYVRIGSGAVGLSTLMTSAPQWARTAPAEGTNAHAVTSTTLIPCMTFMWSPLSPSRQLRRPTLPAVGRQPPGSSSPRACDGHLVRNVARRYVAESHGVGDACAGARIRPAHDGRGHVARGVQPGNRGVGMVEHLSVLIGDHATR